ncbi:MAG: metallophosphoesterase, partial [Sedimentisphaerales bacterium]
QMKSLPAGFNGCKILFITDMHIEKIGCLADRIVSIARQEDYDYCILGGDYSFGFDISNPAIRQRLSEVLEFLKEKCRVFGILGNHDEYQCAEILSRFGVEMLINEHVCLEKEGDKMYLVGVDDYHFFRAAELKEAGAGIPNGAFRIIISHSPELYKEASAAGYSLYLAGHTHGGQICLPGSIAIVANARVPRKMVKGRWEYRGMAGYTSCGAGASIVPMRFFCQPEVVLLTLRKDAHT